MSLDKLLLLSCRSPFLDDSKIYAPMANLYLKSYVEANTQTEVTLGDDTYELTPEYFEPYDAVGLSIMTPQREEALKILHTIKSAYPNKVVIAGGPHVKHYVGDIMKSNEPYDWLVPLDGEKPLVGILKGETNFPHNYIRTAIKFEGDTPRRVIMDNINHPRVLVNIMSKDDIETAPRPDRTSKNAVDIIKGYHYKLGGRESTTMMTARGCPEQCAFCEDAMTPVKRSSIENIRLE
ncbi:MAG: cobalamin-dependent protein, partial [Patescibacteria group bacterium]